MAEEEILGITERKFCHRRVDMTYTPGPNSAVLARSNRAPFRTGQGGRSTRLSEWDSGSVSWPLTLPHWLQLYRAVSWTSVNIRGDMGRRDTGKHGKLCTALPSKSSACKGVRGSNPAFGTAALQCFNLQWAVRHLAVSDLFLTYLMSVPSERAIFLTM